MATHSVSSQDTSAYRQPYQPQQPSSRPPTNAMVPHPQYQQASNYSQHPQQYQVEPYQQSYQQEQLQQLQPPQQPPYDRRGSHQSHHSRHSSHSKHSHHSNRRDEYDDRDYERRPTLGDTLSLIWGTVVGAITGKRR